MKRLILAVLIIGLLLLGACAPTSVSESAIPAHFTTYTDEAGLFSISYPPEWELALSEEIEVLEQFIKEVITSIESDAPVERSGAIFFAGVPTETGYMPSVNIMVEALSGIVWTHDKLVEAEIKGVKHFVQDYHELSRVKTTVGGREATIVEYEGTYPKLDKKYHFLVMVTLVGKTAWIVTCTALPDEYSKWEDDFNAIVKSLRVLK